MKYAKFKDKINSDYAALQWQWQYIVTAQLGSFAVVLYLLNNPFCWGNYM